MKTHKKIVVSIIVLNYNGIKYIDSFFTSALRLKNSDECEYIFVDNNSSDGSSDYVKKKYPYVKIVDNKVNYGTGGYNCGIPLCMGEFIFFTPIDVSLTRTCLIELLPLMKDRTVG